MTSTDRGEFRFPLAGDGSDGAPTADRRVPSGELVFARPIDDVLELGTHQGGEWITTTRPIIDLSQYR